MGEDLVDRTQRLSRRRLLGDVAKGAAVTLAAAGGLQASPSAAASPAPGPSRRETRRQSKTRISYAWPFAATTPAFQEDLANRFNEQSSSVEVEVQIIPQAQVLPRLTTAFSGGVGPDVIAMSPAWLTQFAAAGWLENLEERLAAEGLEPELLPVGMTQGRMYDNTAYMIGYIADTYPLFYNTQFFSEVGLSAPPSTLDEFEEYATQMTDVGQNRFGYYLLGGSGWHFQQFSTWMLNTAGIGVDNTLYDEAGQSIFNQPEQIAGLERWVSLYTEAKVSPPASATADFSDAANAFNAGQIGMVFGFLGYITNFRNGLGADNFGVAFPPAGPAGQFFHYGVNGIALGAQSENKDAAWEFARFLLTPEINELVNQEWGAVPTHLQALEAEYLTDPAFEVPVAMLEQAEAHVHTPRHLPKWAEFFQVQSAEQIQRALLGQQSAQEAAESMAQFLNEAAADAA